MKARSVFILLGVSLFLSNSSSNLLPVALAQPAASAASKSAAASANSNSQVYHIELNTLRDCLHGDCPFRFTDLNFAVSHQGSRYPVHVYQPSGADLADASEIPTHLLVVFPSGTRRPKNTNLLRNLNQVFSKGWLVSVNRPDGSFTPYSTAATLTYELAAAPKAPLTVRQADLAAKSVIKTLESFPGRRLLLLDIAGPYNKTVSQWISLARMTHAQAYIVDGGTIKKVYYDQSWGTGEAYVPGGTDIGYKKVRFNYDGVIHEIKFSAAVKDILKDARYDYDLQFTIPDFHSGPASPITLTLLNAKGILSYEQKAELYTVAKQDENERSIDIRTTPPLSLIVKW